MRLSWFIADRIGKRKSRLGTIGNIIAVGSVAISLVVIVIAMAVTNGFRNGIKNKALCYTGDVTIYPLEALDHADLSQESSYYLDTLSWLEKIKSLDYIKNIKRISERPGMIKTEEQMQAVILEGVEDSFDWSVLKEAIIEGDIPRQQDSTHNPVNPLLISDRLSRLLDLHMGEGVILYFIVNQEIKLRKFEICGIYSLQFEEYDKRYVYTTIDVVNDINGWEPFFATSYVVDYNNHDDDKMDMRRDAIVDLIYENLAPGDPPVGVATIRDLKGNLFDWLKLLDINVLIILVLMILVAGFNMVSSLLIILFENISKIGILKTLGMKNQGIKKIFIVKGSKIVFKGLVIGNIIALLLCYLQKYFGIVKLNPQTYFLDSVPIEINLFSVLTVNIICFISILLILLIPCHFISKISPARSIKIK